MKKLILAVALAISSVMAGSGCKLFCRNCESHYTPPAMAVETAEPVRAG